MRKSTILRSKHQVLHLHTLQLHPQFRSQALLNCIHSFRHDHFIVNDANPRNKKLGYCGTDGCDMGGVEDGCYTEGVQLACGDEGGGGSDGVGALVEAHCSGRGGGCGIDRVFDAGQVDWVI